jgi:hypothetical protein
MFDLCDGGQNLPPGRTGGPCGYIPVVCGFHMILTSVMYGCRILDIKVENFYSVKYGLSIITSNVCQIISVMKYKNTGVSREIIFQNM